MEEKKRDKKLRLLVLATTKYAKFGATMEPVSCVFAKLNQLKSRPEARKILLDALAFVLELMVFGLSPPAEQALIIEEERANPVREPSRDEKIMMVQTVISSLGEFSQDENLCYWPVSDDEQPLIIRVLKGLLC
jgi:hypothetical protein